MKTKERFVNKKNIRKEKGISTRHNPSVSSKTANQGITLVALVVTIVVLLILAGITITLVFSENGIIKKAISSKEANEEGTVKEEIALALLQMRTDKYDKEYNLENIKEWLPEYLDRGQLGELKIENGKLYGEYKGYEFEIDSNYQISYIGKMTGIRISYTLNPEGYTKENITLTLNVTSTQGTIETLEEPEGLTKNENGTYTITTNGTYTFKAIDSAGNEITRDILIDTIDRLAPKKFTPTVENITESSFTIVANAEDEEPKAEADGIKSGIYRYEYYIKKSTDEEYTKYESTQAEYIVSPLEKATEYSIYVIAYDKANNNSTSETTSYATSDSYGDYINVSADQSIYISANSGNDTTGDGTKGKPYATLSKITQSGIITTGNSYNIYLGTGEYAVPSNHYSANILTLSCNKNINLIGNKMDTSLYIDPGFGNNSTASGNGNYTLNFYRLIFKTNSSFQNVLISKNNLNCYNVVFSLNATPSLGYFISSNATNVKVELINCTNPCSYSVNFRNDSGTGYCHVINSYGNFTNGYGTTQSKWDYQTNYITATPSVDSITYGITDTESVWKNVGTGTNPDGTQANLGVYGGEYSWDY